MKKLLLALLAIGIGTATAQWNTWQPFQPFKWNAKNRTGSCATPDAPSGLAVAQNVWDENALTWTDNSGDETEFSLLRCTGSSCTPSVEYATPAADATSYDDTVITQGTVYGYKILAVNACGNSDASATVYITPSYLYGWPSDQTSEPNVVAQWLFDEYWDNFTGITVGSGSNYFRNTSAISQLDIGAGVDVVLDLTFSSTAGSGNTIMSTTSANEANTFEWFWSSNTTQRNYIVWDDGSVTDKSWTITNAAGDDGLIHNYRQVFDRDGNLELFVDNVSMGTVDISGKSARSIACQRLGVLAEPNGNGIIAGTMYEVAIGLGVTSLGTHGPGSGTTPYDYLDTAATGMAAHWKMQEASGNLTDSKNSIVLTKVGSPTYSVAGAGKAAALYDEVSGLKLTPNGATTHNIISTGDYAGISPGVQYNNGTTGQYHKITGDQSALDINDGVDFVFEWWARYDSALTGMHTIFSSTAGAGGRGYYMYHYDTSSVYTEIVFWNEADSYRVFSLLLDPPIDGEFHKYALVGDQTNHFLYVYQDNVLIGDFDATFMNGKSFESHGFTVGAYPNTSQSSKMSFNEFRITIGNDTNSSTGTRSPRPAPSGPPEGGYTHWSAGAYTKALWDAQSLMSGNWTDSVSGIVLTAAGTPTYQVSGTGDYSTWKGVTLDAAADTFTKATGSAALDVGANEHIVVQILANIHSLPQYWSLAGDYNAGAHFLDPYTGYQDRSLMYHGMTADDATNAGTVVQRHWMVQTGMVKYRYVFKRDTSGTLTSYENGTNIGYVQNISGIDSKAITNQLFRIGNAAFPPNATIFAVKIDIGSDAAVLSINDGGPGGG